MKRIWPMDNYAFSPIQTTNQAKDEELSATIYDLCRIAPRMVEQFGFSFNRNNPQKEKAIIYNFMIENVKRCATVRDVAALCIRLCNPYKFPIPNNFDETIIKHRNSEFEKVFHVQEFNEASFRYLILQYLYVHKSIKMDEHLNQLTMDLMKQYYQEKHDILKPKSLVGFPYPNQNFYISKILGIDYSNGDTIYDFIIKSGLDTVKTKWNPYVVNYLHSVESLSEKDISDFFPEDFNKELLLSEFRKSIASLKEKLIKPDHLCHFLSYFHLNDLIPKLNNHNFNSVSNYIAERITNINLINCLYQIYVDSNFLIELKEKNLSKREKEIIERHFTSHFYLLANYPLVSYRLDLLRLLCHGLAMHPCHTTENNEVVIDYSSRIDVPSNFSLSLTRMGYLNPSIRLEGFHDAILFQSLFYFPLLTKLFYELLLLRGEIANDYNLIGLIEPKDGFMLKEDICSLFQIIKSTESEEKSIATPIEAFPAISSAKYSKLYQNIQFCIYQVYYEQVIKLKEHQFIDIGYFHGNDILHFNDSVIEKLELDLTKQFRYLPSVGENPLYINYCGETDWSYREGSAENKLQ